MMDEEFIVCCECEFEFTEWFEIGDKCYCRSCAAYILGCDEDEI